ncbi:hypothetical protein AXG93_1847s1490 [Marchantia polymorpha subsp. ruderalis]|uniref:Elongator complex protein 2 n=1 Tax=Marchantia polymorpha subsp. ruderalis TaxID=1480154 RepID=A0A176VFK8_MARPO|nr:hypothetical protein AXG93_1847s1490 [Marchantia polymorpha subsp. ruderalis]
MGFEASVEGGEMEGGLGSVQVESAFIGLGCNRVVGAVDWGPCDLVAFGAHNSVAIFSPKRAEILITLPGHKDYVNCVLWLPTSAQIDAGRSSCEELFLLSGSADGTLILWGFQAVENKWRKAVEIPKAHGKAVTSIATVILSPSSALMSTSSSDSSVRIWNVGLPQGSSRDCQISPLQLISVGSKTMVATSLTALPDSQDAFLLAMGGLDNQVHFYAGTSKGQFILVCKVKAHLDWVRSLDFRVPARGSSKAVVYLASSSQDKTIKIWKIARRESDVADSSSGATSLKLELSLRTFIDGPIFKVRDVVWQVSLESLLLGHEDWVYSVRWQPPIAGHLGIDSGTVSSEEQVAEEAMCVLSASMDRTMMIWKPSTESGIWMNEVTVGELSHSALGFYGGVWGPLGDAILAHGYGGSLHFWKEVQTQEWEPQLAPSGHFAPVVDLAWSKTSQFLLSVGNDQTARVFACWKQTSKEREKDSLSWHEIGRPQVHGHDLNCLAIVTGTGNHRYVSGADEKVARVFEAPGAFLDTLAFTVGGKVTLEDGLIREDVKILGANMSALGLSQKPIYSQGKGNEAAALNDSDEAGLNTMDALPEAVPSALTKPPFEEHLSQNTLWPETHKLYGHGNELFAMCCDHSGKLLATACKALSANFAQIWLWQVNSWRPIDQLKSHVLTVTQMEFSHSDRFLLSVSRDRHLSVFERVCTDDNEYTSSPYKLVTRIDGHKRIIWACSWSHCDSFFATGSRDKIVKIWSVQDTETGVQVQNIITLPPFKSSVTALAWGPKLPQQKAYLLAVGMEDGSVELWQGSLRQASESDFNIVAGDGTTSLWKLEMSILEKFDKFLCHVATVHRLTWRAHLSGHERSTSPEIKSTLGDSSRSEQRVDEVLQLASCGADHSIRLYNVILG